jgi:hypothetical protein
MAIEQALTGAVSRAITPAIAGVGADVVVPPDLWVDPAIDAKRVMNGGNVVTMQKLAGTLADPTQATPAEQPLYVANGINGLGAIESQDALRELNSLNVLASPNISFVAQFGWMRTAANNNYVFSMSFKDGAVDLSYVLDFQSGKFRSRSWSSSVGFFGQFFSANTFGTSVPLVVTVIYDAPGSSVILRVNGTQEGSTSSVHLNATTIYNIHLLNHWGVATLSLIGQRMGAFMANVATLPSMRQILIREQYLINRYI